MEEYECKIYFVGTNVLKIEGAYDYVSQAVGGNGVPGALHADFLDALYEQYKRDPQSVSEQWRSYFSHLASSSPSTRGKRSSAEMASSAPTSLQDNVQQTSEQSTSGAELQKRVNQLVWAYRTRGHMLAQLDPLGFEDRGTFAELNPGFYGFTETDYDRPVAPGTISADDVRTVRDVIERLQNTYCRSIGVEFMHIDDAREREWLQERMESTENRVQLTRDEQLRILTRLTDATIFEQFIQRNYVGAKSFSLEGGESLIPLLDLAIEKAGEQGIVEIVMAMAHRGRLNVLANILGKHPDEIFREFEDRDPHLYIRRGDVKYHLGHSSDWETTHGEKVHLSLCFNPSHLEYVNPVALGRLRAKQDRVGDTRGKRSMALLIHGDASFSGEGIVQETLNLSRLPAYSVGGALHVVVNNQIGFTTLPRAARSSTYATDIAKMLQSPIFHVNGEDPEAVAKTVRLAMEFRYEFARDVVIDMYCYRKYGHNEGDEPSFTQPLLYDAVRKRKSVREGYLDHLLQHNGLKRSEADRIEQEREQRLENALQQARREDYQVPLPKRRGIWSPYTGGPSDAVQEVDTTITRHALQQYMRHIATVPNGFQLHRRLRRLFEARRAMAEGERPIDWAMAEAVAFASLAHAGHRVRLTGQDSERGTFSQRHAVLHDVKTGEEYAPLQHIAEEQAPVEIYNSPLAEASVLGFEYGFSLDYPEGLIMWEAQFGDFVNVAQVIIDQFIASAEEKWNRLSGLVMLLPHGLEGQGPEHASARVERFLNLAAEDNIQIAIPTTPSQYFHVLRRQVLRSWRKPLVLFTPKSLLRHPRVVSPIDAFTDGAFMPVIPDEGAGENVSRVLICSGKIYYELAAHREKHNRWDVAIIRLEQLYPLDQDALQKQIKRYPDAPIYWVQEEPANNGVWPYLRYRFGSYFVGKTLHGIYRDESASPATGSYSSHVQEQSDLIERAFGS